MEALLEEHKALLADEAGELEYLKSLEDQIKQLTVNSLSSSHHFHLILMLPVFHALNNILIISKGNLIRLILF